MRTSLFAVIALCCAILVMVPVSAAAAAANTAATTTITATTGTTGTKVKEPSFKETAKKTSKFESGALNLDDSEGSSSKKSNDAKKSNAGSAGRMIFGLVFVLALIFGVNSFLKRINQKRLPSSGAGTAGMIEVVSTTPLAANRNLHLVRIGNEMLLIGATEHSITQLRSVETESLTNHAGNTGDAEFQSALYGALNPTAPAAPDSFVRKMVNSLQMMTSR